MREYLDYKNCKCRKKFAYSLAKEREENIDKNEIIHNKLCRYKSTIKVLIKI